MPTERVCRIAYAILKPASIGVLPGTAVASCLHPKAGCRQRPLGTAALEDKIVQRAVVEVLDAIYETDFVGFSYGFRPGRGQHDALDALVVGIEHRADAERFLEAVRTGMAEFALELHPDKTRLIEFGRQAASNRTTRGEGKLETFNFLGFIHICSRSRKGGFVLARHTRRDRKMAKLLEIKEKLRRRWHQDKAEQGEWLGAVVRGFFAYHAVPTNTRALSSFRYHVLDLWRRALRRHSQRDRTTWNSMARLADHWLPMLRIAHPWPSQRFRVKHPRWTAYAGKPHVRFCAVGAQ